MSAERETAPNSTRMQRGMIDAKTIEDPQTVLPTAYAIAHTIMHLPPFETMIFVMSYAAYRSQRIHQVEQEAIINRHKATMALLTETLVGVGESTESLALSVEIGEKAAQQEIAKDDLVHFGKVIQESARKIRASNREILDADGNANLKKAGIIIEE